MAAEDITTNEVLSTKLDYIQKDITTIKGDIREIKSDFITRREHETSVKDLDSRYQIQISDINNKVSFLNKVLYSLVGLLVTATIGAVLKLIYKQ